MMRKTLNGAAAYRKNNLEGQLNSASPHGLVMMLFDGARLSVGDAVRFMEAGDIAAKGAAISRCIEIISSGLQASLNMEAGGELAERLDSLYEYMGQRLLHANLKNDVAALHEVGTLIDELKSAWAQIGQEPGLDGMPQEAGQ